jgi:hypothetical protein
MGKRGAPTATANDEPRKYEPNRRIVGPERMTLAKDLVERYSAGASIRDLTKATGRSYGFCHRMLVESGVVLRARLGKQPNPARALPTAPAQHGTWILA